MVKTVRPRFHYNLARRDAALPVHSASRADGEHRTAWYSYGAIPRETEMGAWAGKWALVTGASAGIGLAIAEELAAGGANLVLTARREERLTAIASDLRNKHSISTEIIVADLAEPAAPRAIFDFTQQRGIEIELLVNNAGFGHFNAIPRADLQRLLDMVQVNCSAVVHLTRLYTPGMIAHGHGDVLIVASTAAFQAVPYISTYAATKAFDLLFAEGIAEELKPYGVRVCALCPGSTESEFHDVAGHPSTEMHRHREAAQQVARNGLAALAAGKSYVISGLKNYLGAHGERLVPRRFVTRMAARVVNPEHKG
jgi:short-subunit dehydrogenase